MRLIICTNHCYNIQPQWLKYTNGLKEKYCQLYNIKYYHNSNRYYNNTRPQWFKLPMIKECFNMCQTQDDWVLWMDADASIINMKIDIREYIFNEQKKIIMGKDYNGFNSGVFAVPNTHRGKQWVNYIDNSRINVYNPLKLHEQYSMIDSFKNDYKDFYKLPPQQIGWNMYTVGNTYRANEFIPNKSWCLHMPQRNSQDRIKYFGNYYKLINSK